MRKQVLLCAALAFAVLFAFPAPLHAAVLDISSAVTANFNKTAAAADSKQKAELDSNFKLLSSLQKQDADLQAKIDDIHRKNTEAEKLLRKQIQNLDADTINKLEKEADALKAKYEPLFEQYTALNKRIEAVKALKNKDLNTVLNVQKETLKAAVTLARQDIGRKQDALKKAKDKRSRTQKQLRGILSEADSLEKKIKAEKSAVSTTKKSLEAEWKTFKTHIKAQDAKNAGKSLSKLVTLSKKIVEKKKNIYSLEADISRIITKAKNQMPKS